MKVLVIGSGGREHAIVDAVVRSPLAGTVYCAPGNAGTGQVAINVGIKADDIKGLLQFAQSYKIDVTIVGPEDPLAKGIVDEFQAAGLKIFGPNKAAAQLESSKVFAKRFMVKNSIPTAMAKFFDSTDSCRDFVARFSEEEQFPLVIKVDGLAAGKGVEVCKSHQAALDFLEKIDSGKFKGADGTIIVEQCLEGEEASCIFMVDENGGLQAMASSQDHKPRDDGDQGPNTGGMGAYSPAPVITPMLEEKIMKKIIVPTIDGLKIGEGISFTGFLYAGLMIVDGDPYVLEFNVRMGDPEAQPIFSRMKSDLLETILAALEGKLHEKEIQWDPNPAVCVVMASRGYPDSYEKGFEISGIYGAEMFGAKVFHAGTVLDGEKVLINGGRVLGVTISGKNFSEAVRKAYLATKLIICDNLFYRGDIAHRAVAREKK